MSSLGQKARSAVFWNTGFNLFRDLLQFGTMLILVRLLAPEAYGQFGLVTSILGFIGIFSFKCFMAHTLQLPPESAVPYQDHFTAGAVLAGIMFLVTNLLAVALRWFESYAPVAGAVHAMSLTWLLDWPCELRRKMLERALDWKRLRLLHALGLVGSAGLAIALAAAGAGVYALLIPGMTVTLPFIFDLFVLQGWRPHWTWSWARYREAWHFGLTRIGSAAASSARQLAESGTLSRVLGFATLGIFNRALGLAQMFCIKFSDQLLYAIYPVLTRLGQDANKVAQINGLVLRFVAWVVVPVGMVFSLLAAPVVNVVYGPKWREVIPLLPWAMLCGVLMALSQSANSLLLARQAPFRCLLVDGFVLGGTGLLLVLVLPHGLEAYVKGLAILQLAAFAVLSGQLLKVGALRLAGLAGALLPPIICAMVAGLACEFARGALHSAVATFWAASAYGVGFMVVYLVALRLMFADLFGEMVHHLPARSFVGRVLLLKTVG